MVRDVGIQGLPRRIRSALRGRSLPGEGAGHGAGGLTAVAETGTPPEQPDDGRVGISIDGRELRVPKGTLVLDAATEAGIHIPIYCAHPKMDPVAVCRMCLVNIEKFPKPQPACATVAGDGMVVRTDLPEVTKLREGMLEFLLLNHPLDCPVCDRGGECDLQDFTFRYGPGISRFPITEKVHFKKAIPLSEHIELDQERCILCWRCVRYYDEITGEKEIVLQQRGVDTLVSTFDDRQLESKFQGNLPEVCPVGALTHRKYRFVSRPWDLQRTASICPECSYGCNINVDSRDFEVRRFASRDNPLVDDMWLCDRGRYSFDRWNSSERVRRPVVRSDNESRDVARPRGDHAGCAPASRDRRRVRRRIDRRARLERQHQRGAVPARAHRAPGDRHAARRPSARCVRRTFGRGARARHRRDRGLRHARRARRRARGAGAGAHASSVQGGAQEERARAPPERRRLNC